MNPQLPPWWQDFIINVSEIPDRNSPDDEPAAMMATAQEMENCALNAIERHLAKGRQDGAQG